MTSALHLAPSCRSVAGLSERFADPARLEPLKWLAVLAMICDHLALTVLPQHQWLRAIGTFAYPVFVMSFGVGLASSRDPLRAARALVLPYVVAQAAWLLISPSAPWNVLLVCIYAAMAIAVWRYLQPQRFAWVALLVPFALLAADLHGYEGGVLGFAMLAGAFLFALGSPWLLLASSLLWFVLLPSSGFLLGVFAVVFLPRLPFTVPRVRGLLAWVYAGHLAVLAALMRFGGVNGLV